jgi:hypothetical protein
MSKQKNIIWVPVPRRGGCVYMYGTQWWAWPWSKWAKIVIPPERPQWEPEPFVATKQGHSIYAGPGEDKY